MKKLFPTFILIFVLNLYLPTNAGPWPKNYYKGKFYDSVKDFFLVASKTMKDPRFKNTVIVMLDNDEAGAWGLVVNKPLASVPLGSLIHKSRNTTAKQKELFNVKIPVYWGGPVEPEHIFFIHSSDYKSNNFISSNRDFTVTQEPEILFDIVKNKGPKEYIILSGIAAWEPGQLDSEMMQNNWDRKLHNYTSLFDNGKEMWSRLINSRDI